METNAAIRVNTSTSRTATAFTQMVERLYAEQSVAIGNQGTLASVIGTCFASMSQVQNAWKREAFRDLLLHLEAQGCYRLLRDEVYINVIANVATFGNKTVRSIETWENDSFVAENQISSLIRYLFAQYEVPEFMESVFYAESKIHMLWYVQLGRGESVSKLSGFPVSFTKRMAHEFKNAPANLSMFQAIRWAQAKGYDASETMAETIAWSSLSEHFEQEVFWEKVIVFLSKLEEVSFSKVQEVLFYIKEQFQMNRNFCMKGRTWVSLVRDSDAWHVEFYKRMDALNRAEWTTSGIAGFEKIVFENNGCTVYKIIELVNSESLYEEGYEMSHCVAEYEYACVEGQTAIFSLRKSAAETQTTLATIEVDLETKTVVQAKAHYNEWISDEAYGIVIEWAEKENLEPDFEYYTEAENQMQFQPPIENREVVPNFEYFEEYNRGYTTNYGSDFDWKWILYFVITLIKLVVLFGK